MIATQTKMIASGVVMISPLNLHPDIAVNAVQEKPGLLPAPSKGLAGAKKASERRGK
jgi:hypothetical protein